jgi:Tol biopolymer transport system component
MASNGVLNPRFSPDGTKLLWASKIAGVSGPAPFGEWNLQLADFSLPGGVPTISNVTTLTPGSGLFYESQGFSRDNTKIIYTSDAGVTNPYGLDIFTYTLSGGAIVNISNSGTEWDEHASWAPHVDKIAFMSTRPYPTYNAGDVPSIGLVELRAETIIVNPDGTDRRQLTHFNVAGFPEYNAEYSVATVVGWDPNGTRLAVAQLLVGASYDTAPARMIWIVNFNGEYQ